MQLPVYVHFPLIAGAGIGDALDCETGKPADWCRVEGILNGTDSFHVNVHLSPERGFFPQLRARGLTAAEMDDLAAAMLTDLLAVVRRFGAERVAAENDPAFEGYNFVEMLEPGIITRLVEEAGCGLLLDVAHTCISAPFLGMTAQEYMEALPVGRLREMHLSGTRLLEGEVLERFQRAAPEYAGRAGQMHDHFAMSAGDWALAEWAVGRVLDPASGWGRPRAVALECGGFGSIFEEFVGEADLREMLPRLERLVKGGEGIPPGLRQGRG